MSSSSSSNKLDPLILLRRAITSRNDIHLISSENQKVFTLSDCSMLSLPSSSGQRILIPKTLVTRYRKPDSPIDSTPLTSPEHFYDLQSILLCYLNRESGVGSYIQEANLQKCSFVTATERKLLNDYLESKNSIEPNRILQIDLSHSLYQDLNHQINSIGHPNTTDHHQSKVSNHQTNAQESLSTHHQDLSVETQNGIAGGVVGAGGGVGPSPNKRVRYIVDKPDQELVKRIMKLHEIRQVSDRKSNRFEPPNVLRTSGTQTTASEDVVEVRHRRGYTSSHVVLPSSLGGHQSNSSSDRAARYFVVDGVDALSKFGEDAWDRVVCVMTTGQEWQFRPYRWSDPKELFHHVKGFFMQWTHDPPNPKVRAWNVTELRIDQSKRHIDKSAAADFWRSLEAWIALHKPFVAY
ncbi:uncharacterized protein MELLADRAFT_117789 [Melampsora larici-populina 98AG31]|uniref:Cell division control protein 73 C-terminal domain-containing protein n=1 Tax=Melampsora larici-populina (strain 98AG31 / pathotype 3-4-7) TaxID=747676 RepID=F4S1K7_MELLP|nr:uncharacterized protein MELLADRAFT_117789 [Melampsora larici-populina 98AG31]EGG01489.1 hypothetical protein MELLADRAFT_117789 [Melampsora larici-populina 98AG31]